MKFLNQNDMKQMNAAFVFGIIRNSGTITRKQLEKESGLSWGAVSKITSRLLENKYLIEQEPQRSAGAGRNPVLLSVNREDHYIAGLDINHSGFRSVLVNMGGETLTRAAFKPKYRNAAEYYREIEKFAVETAHMCGNKKLTAIGIAMQGVVDSEQGISKSLPLIPEWRNVRLAETLSQKTGIPVYLEHDPECILIAENARKKAENAILLRIDNGIGMAVIRGGKLEGTPGMYEIGHLCVEPGGRPCPCGKKGCLEQYVTIPALEGRSGMDIEALAGRARAGDRRAAAEFDVLPRLLGRVLAGISVILNIDSMIICGNMCDYSDLFMDKLTDEARRYGSELNLKISDVGLAAYGAALAATDKAIEKLL